MSNETPSESTLSRLRIVLCRPNHPGNIGSAARAMKTMGLGDLRLVAPERYPAPEAEWMATHGKDVLAAARIVSELPEAIGDCVASFAFSARGREWSPEVLPLREAAALAIDCARQGPVAMVFGNETSGLSNTELMSSQYHVHIPADPVYSSLNLAQAVQVAAYELRMAALAAAGLSVDSVTGPNGPMLATVADREGLYQHLDDAGAQSGFYDPEDPKRLPERWRRLFSRIRLEREEVNILRGLLRALARSPNRQ